MPLERLARFTLLPELKLTAVGHTSTHSVFETAKESAFEVCPRCATKATAVYDRRTVTIKDAPVRGRAVLVKIRKRRFWCRSCQKPFTEAIPGISKGYRSTARYRSHLLWACENFCDLKSVKRHMHCSYSSLYRIYYEQLELELRKRRYPWPKIIGIDEHKFKRNKQYGFTEFVSMVVDHGNKRVFELVEGRATKELEDALAHIPGRENVKIVTLDLSKPYKSYIANNFPNATLVADKFHVVRLLHPAINRHRIDITGDKRKNPVRRLLLKDSRKLDFFERNAIYKWLNHYPDLKEIYEYKEAIHRFYRTKGLAKAKRALIAMTDRMATSKLPEVLTLRRTLLAWRREILAYFKYRYTNGRTEGFNGKAKLIKRRAYGYRSFKNYRLRVLNACS